jgi:hypothetical protein
MRRHETALVVLALVLLIGAWELASDATPPVFNSTAGEVPWGVLLWQFRQTLAPAFALVGLASAVGILFLRAARWATTTGSATIEPRQEPAQQPEQNGAANPPQG